MPSAASPASKRCATSATPRRSASPVAATPRTSSAPSSPAPASPASPSPNRPCTTSSSASPDPKPRRPTMHSILLVAKRDYIAAVRTKAFLFGLIVAPILFGSGFIGIAVTKAKPDIQERKVAIVDRTGVAAASIVDAATAKNNKELFDKKTGKQLTPRYVFEIVVPDDAQRTAQLLALSDRVRHRELFAV